MAQDTTWAGAVLSESDINAFLMHEGNGWTTYTPTLVQSGAVAKTVTRAAYARSSRLIHVRFNLAVTGAGSATFPILVGTPTTAITGVDGNDVVGIGFVRDASANIKYRGEIVFQSTTAVQFLTLHSTTDGFLGNVDMTAALASGDLVTGSFFYESAA